MDRITFEDALALIDTGKCVSLSYVSFDKKRKTGGKLKVLNEAVVTNPKSERRNTSQPGTKSSKVSPNNKENSTRNFYKCINGKPTNSIRKVHVILMLEINGMQIML